MLDARTPVTRETKARKPEAGTPYAGPSGPGTTDTKKSDAGAPIHEEGTQGLPVGRSPDARASLDEGTQGSPVAGSPDAGAPLDEGTPAYDKAPVLPL